MMVKVSKMTKVNAEMLINELFFYFKSFLQHYFNQNSPVILKDNRAIAWYN
jgi:hypothetical protein